MPNGCTTCAMSKRSGCWPRRLQAPINKAKTVSLLKELARVHTENKQKDKAGEVFRKIEFVPKDPDALEFLGPGAVAVAPTPVRPPPAPDARCDADPRAGSCGECGPEIQHHDASPRAAAPRPT